MPRRSLKVPVRALCSIAFVGVLSACATPPKSNETPAPPPYEQLLEEGRQAQQAGNGERAAELWRTAAKQNPAAKEPWLRLAQMHFDAGDYGATISEAQEAMQRDGTDAVANGLLAVSGLRVSSAALARMHADTLSGSTRGEAESLARTLREMLGAPVLVPQPANASNSGSRNSRQPSRQPAAAVATVPASAPVKNASATPAAPPAKAAATPPAGQKDNKPAQARDPFGALR